MQKNTAKKSPLKKGTEKMKKVILMTSIVTIAIFTIISCKKEAEVYSCDEATNTWAKKTRTANQNISRLELVRCGIDSQFSIFRSLSNINKKRIFLEKVAYIIANNNLSALEINHLNALDDNFKEDFYNDGNIEGEEYIANWEYYAKNSLNWDEKKLTLNLGTWLTDDDVAMLPNVGGGGTNPPKIDCNCLSNLWCDWMSQGYTDCNKKACNSPKGGCGFFGKETCLGKCWFK